MKKLYYMLTIIVIFLTVLACGGEKLKVTIKNTAELNEVKGINMTIKKGTLKRTGAIIIITDYTDSSDLNSYGSYYRIDKKVNGNWEKLDTVSDTGVVSDLLFYYVKNNKLTMKINWKFVYGELEDGEYRIVKSVNIKGLEIKNFSVEFKIG